jgi:hypothetical protein
MFKLSDFSYKVLTCIVLLGIYLYLSSIYSSFILKLFAYRGLLLNHNIFNELISLGVLLFSLIILLILPSKPNVFATSVIIKILFLIPCLVLFAKMGTDFRIILSMILLDFLFISVSLISFRFYSPKIKAEDHIYILVGLVILLLIPIVKTFGTTLNLSLLLLKDIYKFRLIARQESTVLASYAMFWTSKIILPILIIYGAILRKKKMVFISVFIMLFIFLVTGAHKAILFSIFIFLYFYFVKNYLKKIFWFTLGILAISIIGIILYNRLNIITLADLMIRRTLFDPAFLDICYFDFFDHNHMHLSHSIFKGFIDNPYPVQPSYMIGKVYFNHPLENAGNGIISDGFMNFGMFGVIISILIAVTILKYCLSANISHHFFGIIFIIIYGFSSTGILTNILNGGIFIAILIIQFILKDLRFNEQEGVKN